MWRNKFAAAKAERRRRPLRSAAAKRAGRHDAAINSGVYKDKESGIGVGGGWSEEEKWIVAELKSGEVSSEMRL